MDITSEQHHTGATAGFEPAHGIEQSYNETFHGSGAPINIGEFYTPASGHLDRVLIKFVKPPGIVEKIQDEILRSFSLNMSDLAALCYVSRKTSYNWRANEKSINRRKKGMDRLFEISKAAHSWRGAGYPKPGDFLREPVINGHSLFELLAAKAIDLDAIQFLGARLAMRQGDTSDVINPFT